MDVSTLQDSALETDLSSKAISVKQPIIDECSRATVAALQSKRDLHRLQHNRIFREYGKAKGPRIPVARPISGYPVPKSDGRICVSLCIEAAAEKQQHAKSGVWCPVSGTPYASLGVVDTLQLALPDLFCRQAQADSAAKQVPSAILAPNGGNSCGLSFEEGSLFCRAAAALKQKAASEEQHAAVVRHLQGSTSGNSSGQPAHRSKHRLVSCVDRDDAWLESLTPRSQSLLVRKQPVTLTRADQLETR